MQSALRRPWSSVRDWVSRRPMIAAGGFGSGIFLIVGLAGMLTALPALRDWLAAADWPTTEAEITASRLIYVTNSRAASPDFTFRYEWQGRVYLAHGYDLLETYATGDGVNHGAVLQAHPVGSRVLVLVNPERPTQAVLIRGTIGGLILLVVPFLFFIVGMVGMFFTVITARGWLGENSPNPLGRAIHAAGGWLVQGKVLKTLFFVIFGIVLLGLVVAGVVFKNPLLFLFAGVTAWTLWRASRPQPAGGSEDGQGEQE